MSSVIVRLEYEHLRRQQQGLREQFPIVYFGVSVCEACWQRSYSVVI